MVDHVETRRKRKIVRRGQEVDPNTGEVLDFRVYGVSEEFDINYSKIFHAFTEALLNDDEIMGKAIRLLFWITGQIKKDEIEFFMTYDAVKRDLNVSRSTYYRWKETLENKRIIQRVSNSIYRLNPACIVKGEGHVLIDEWRGGNGQTTHS